MKEQTICRRPLQGQERFIIATAYVKTKNLRRSVECCRDMYVNCLHAGGVGAREAAVIAAVCAEAGVECVFDGPAPKPAWPLIPVLQKAFSPEKLRRDVFSAVLCGARGIEYDSILDDSLVWKHDPEPIFHFLQDMNYRLTQYGRTLMALKHIGVYCSDKTAARYPTLAPCRSALAQSQILAGQELPEGLAVGEFADGENNRYLLYQNVDHADKRVKTFRIKLARTFRVYRVNPHNGKQVLVKDRMDGQSILIMPGDGDLLRYQPADEEPFLIEYALKK